MREIERTIGFKRDFKREAQGRHRTNLNGSWIAVLRFLAVDTLLPYRYDHYALIGDLVQQSRLQWGPPILHRGYRPR